jgi:cold shock protein
LESAVLREGQAVEFEVGEGPRGPQAVRVRVTGDLPPDAPVGVLGTIAWYEPAKGYGFAQPDGGGPEIFVHSSAIVVGGVVTAGQRVAFLVVDGERGPQAEHLLPLGAGAGVPGAGHQNATDGADGTVSWFGRQGPGAPARAGEGVVARYDADRGFGFITPDAGGDDLFVHTSGVRGAEPLRKGERVRYSVRQSDRSPQADRVERI